MATNFPSSLDSFTNPSATDTLDSPPHDTQHADANDAIEALEAKVGVDGSAVTSSHDYILSNGVLPTLNVDSGVLVVDETNDRVGVNDSTPSYALDVTGDINATGDFRTNGTLFYPVSYADTTLSVTSTTTPASYLLSMPTGVTVNNLVSFFPKSAVNNTLTIYYYRLGGWSGVQTTSQILLNCALGNGAHTEAFTIRFYYRV